MAPYLNFPAGSQKYLQQVMQKNKVCNNAFMRLPMALFSIQFKPRFKIRDFY
jgi:hypothetical protein